MSKIHVGGEGEGGEGEKRKYTSSHMYYVLSFEKGAFSLFPCTWFTARCFGIPLPSITGHRMWCSHTMLCVGNPLPIYAPHGNPLPIYAPHGNPLPIYAPHGNPLPIYAPHGNPLIYAPHGNPLPIYAPHGTPYPFTHLIETPYPSMHLMEPFTHLW
jgi:hypothetical protein